MIEVDQLVKSYGPLTAVDHASFSVDEGQIFGFIGPNGAGKTTTIRILATLESPDAGNGYIQSHSVIHEPEEVQRMIGYLPDNYGVYKKLRIDDYLEFFGRSYGLRGDELRRRIDYIMDFTEVRDMRKRQVSELSAGMEQRLCLARTLINDPDVLLLDEPAANLDPRARVEIRELIRELAEQEKTILISSHILAELSEICDSLAIIEQGKIVVTGTVETVLDEIQPERELAVRFADPGDSQMETLAVLPNVDDVYAAPPEVRVKFNGTEEEVPDFIERMLSEGLRPVEVKYDEQNLEDIFMEVTEGELQ